MCLHPETTPNRPYRRISMPASRTQTATPSYHTELIPETLHPMNQIKYSDYSEHPQIKQVVPNPLGKILSSDSEGSDLSK